MICTVEVSFMCVLKGNVTVVTIFCQLNDYNDFEAVMPPFLSHISCKIVFSVIQSAFFWKLFIGVA